MRLITSQTCPNRVYRGPILLDLTRHSLSVRTDQSEWASTTRVYTLCRPEHHSFVELAHWLQRLDPPGFRQRPGKGSDAGGRDFNR